jgi:hypothetical protein
MPEKGDAEQWCAALKKKGLTTEQLRALLEAGRLDLEDAPPRESYLCRGGAPSARGAPPAPVVARLSDVAPEAVEWLWRDRLPRGKLSLLDGDPGLGKSTLLFDLAARVSRGEALPGDDATRAPAGVVILSAEDGLADTIRPRLDAAGADLSRIVALTGIAEGPDRAERLPQFPGDIQALEATLREVGAALVLIDPLMAYLGGDVDSHKDQDVRRALGALARVAESTRAAVVIVRHLNKARGGSALYRGSGSIGIVGAARSALLVARDPDAKDAEELRVLAPIKSNLGPPAPSLRFRVVGAPNGAARIEWHGASPHRADDLVAEPTSAEERDAVSEATDTLREILKDGPVRSDEVKRQAKSAGVAERTLWRAKGRLRVVATPTGRYALWSLPARAETLGSLGRDGDPEVISSSYTSAKTSANLCQPLPTSAKTPATSATSANLGRGVRT